MRSIRNSVKSTISDKLMFDVAILNPPYDRNLHLKVLEQVIPVAEKVINISPVRWLQDPFAPYLGRSDYNKFEESVSKHIKDLEIIPAKKASELFQEASFTMNLGIYTCDSEGGWNYRHDDPLVNKIVEKTMENSWEPYAQKYFYKNGCIQVKPYVLNTAGVLSGGVLNSTYDSQCKVTLSNPESIKKGGVGSDSAHFEFDTEEERKNFYDCYCHPFMKWQISLWKRDVHTKTIKVPYFGDYTKPWTNDMFKEYFGITDEEWKRVEREMAVAHYLPPKISSIDKSLYFSGFGGSGTRSGFA